MVTVARIRRPQGRRGEVLAELLTDFPERFSETSDVVLCQPSGGERQPGRLENWWLHKGGIVLKFAGVEDISAAEALAGWEVRIPIGQRRPLDAGAVYWSDLSGCRVIEDGRDLGVVRHIDPTIGTPVLVIDTPEGGELLVPFAEEICRRVDVAGKVIEVALPEGLRDLNR